MPRFKLKIISTQWHEHHDLLPPRPTKPTKQIRKRSPSWQSRYILKKVEFKPSRKFLIGNITLCNFIFWKHVNIWLWDPSLPQLFLNISEQQIELPPALTVVPHITSQHYCGTKPVITLPQCLTSWLWIKQCLHNLYLLSFPGFCKL